jgi:hypothetical protein
VFCEFGNMRISWRVKCVLQQSNNTQGICVRNGCIVARENISLQYAQQIKTELQHG